MVVAARPTFSSHNFQGGSGYAGAASRTPEVVGERNLMVRISGAQYWLGFFWKICPAVDAQLAPILLGLRVDWGSEGCDSRCLTRGA